jgi:hypothetical protein
LSTPLYLLALALAAAAAWSRGRTKSRGLPAGLAVAALAALALGLAARPQQPELQLLEYEEIAGYVLGTRMLEDIPAEGPILVLRSPSPADSDEPSAARLRGLRQACSGRTLVEAGPDPLDWGPPSGDFRIFDGDSWTAQVAPWCREYPDAAAVVSLLFEFPTLDDAGNADLPPLYGFTAGPSTAWMDAMQNHTLQAVVRYKPGASARDVPQHGASPQEVFNLRFDLLTPDNARDATPVPR